MISTACGGKINGEKTMDRKNTNVTFTDKEIKEEVLTLENYEVKDIDYDHGVYKSTLSLSTEDEQEAFIPFHLMQD